MADVIDGNCISAFILGFVFFLALITRTNIKPSKKKEMGNAPKSFESEKVNPTVVRFFREKNGFVHQIEEAIIVNAQKRECTLVSTKGDEIEIPDWDKLKADNRLQAFLGNQETVYFYEGFDYVANMKNKEKRLEMEIRNKDRELAKKSESFTQQVIETKKTVKEMRKAESRGGSYWSGYPQQRRSGWGAPPSDGEFGDDS